MEGLLRRVGSHPMKLYLCITSRSMHADTVCFSTRTKFTVRENDTCTQNESGWTLYGFFNWLCFSFHIFSYISVLWAHEIFSNPSPYCGLISPSQMCLHKIPPLDQTSHLLLPFLSEAARIFFFHKPYIFS